MEEEIQPGQLDRILAPIVAVIGGGRDIHNEVPGSGGGFQDGVAGQKEGAEELADRAGRVELVKRALQKCLTELHEEGLYGVPGTKIGAAEELNDLGIGTGALIRFMDRVVLEDPF